MALDIEMDSVVLKRMRHFAQMAKLKKMALMVVGQNLSPDELSGGSCRVVCTASPCVARRMASVGSVNSRASTAVPAVSAVVVGS